jgi:hypothetical protein
VGPGSGEMGSGFRCDVYDSGVCVMAGCSVYWCVDSSSRVSSGPSTMSSLIVLFVQGWEFHQMIEIEGWMKMLSRQACSSSQPSYFFS